MFGARALLRASFYGFLLWLLLAFLWMGLPSPSHEDSRDLAAYSTQVLDQGNTLTRVYELSDFYPYIDRSESVQEANLTPRRSFALSYTLSRDKNFLRINDDCPVNLRPPYDQLPYLSGPYRTAAKTGDQDGINPPWFNLADSTLLFWWIHRDQAVVTIRLRWTQGGTVEIWPDSERFPPKGSLDSDDVPGHITPLLTLENVSAEPSNLTGPFKALPPPATMKASTSPSKTYTLRLAILYIIAPTGLLVYTVVGSMQPIVALLFNVALFLLEALVAVCILLWLIKGRKAVEETLINLRIFSPRQRRAVWGVAGPIEMDESHSQRSERSERRPIQSIADFFQSSAPLDDLLATFESTRHLTEPMDWSRQSESHNTHRSTSETFGRHRKTYSDEARDELIDLEAAMPEKAILRENP